MLGSIYFHHMDVEDDPDLRELSFNDTVKRTVWKTFKVTIKFPQPQKKKKKNHFSDSLFFYFH